MTPTTTYSDNGLVASATSAAATTAAVTAAATAAAAARARGTLLRLVHLEGTTVNHQAVSAETMAGSSKVTTAKRLIMHSSRLPRFRRRMENLPIFYIWLKNKHTFNG